MDSDQSAFWSVRVEELLRQLDTKDTGLTESEAENRLKIYGSNTLKEKRSHLR